MVFIFSTLCCISELCVKDEGLLLPLCVAMIVILCHCSCSRSSSVVVVISPVSGVMRNKASGSD